MVDITQPAPWNRVAKGYADTALAHFGPYVEAALQFAEVKAGDRVLDTATGPGTLAVVAASLTEVVAVDFSEEMVAIVRNRAREEGLDSLRAEVADGQNLPFDDASFDAAFSMFGLFMYEDREAGFRELARVLMPGGRAVVSSWPPRDGAHPFSLAGQLLRPEDAEEQPDFAVMPLSDPDDLAREMRAAGFDARVERVDHTLTFESASVLAAGMLRSHVGFVALEDSGDAARYQRVAAALETRLRDALGDGPVEVPLSAWLGVGIKR